MTRIAPFLIALTLTACLPETHRTYVSVPDPAAPKAVTPAPKSTVCATAPSPATGGKQVTFELGKGSNMCWAAVANYVSQLAGAPIPQCEIASAMQDQPTTNGCCDDRGRVTPACDNPGLPNHVLEQLLGISSRWIESQLPEDQMQAEITAGSPVILELEDAAGINQPHFVFVSYYEPYMSNAYYQVLDPQFGTVSLSYGQLAAGYHIQGDWTWSWTLHNISRDDAACGL